MEQVTPRILCDLYRMLSDDDKDEFQKLFAGVLKSRDLFLMVDKLPLSERDNFTKMTFGKTVEQLLPLMVAHACRLIKDKPELIGKEEFTRELEQHVKTWGENAAREIRIREQEQLKKQRDPPKRKTERDAEIIRLAKLGKTAGAIHRDIKSRWPCTRGAVNQVVIRAKRDGLLPM